MIMVIVKSQIISTYSDYGNSEITNYNYNDNIVIMVIVKSQIILRYSDYGNSEITNYFNI